ncbi:MAG: hypothetical protein PVI57_09770 [Gemmatimonadota bacterium]
MTTSARLALSALLALLLAGCGQAVDGGDVIDRETFIATYIDLRRAAFRSPTRELDTAKRARVLESHGVTEEQLLEFTDVHGRDVDFMMELWTEVEDRMDSLATAPSDTST